jgi:uncharacterized SAM-binding protein YcdF (DUF218 family)
MILLDKLAIVVLSPLGTSLCLLGVAFLLAWRRRLRISAGAGVLAFAWLWVWSMPVVSGWLRGSIEYRHPPGAISALPQAQAIVVLGGALSPPTGRAVDSNLGAAADRVWHAAHLFHAGKAPLVLLSGGSDPQQYRYSEARAMAGFLGDLGVPENAMLLEEASGTTRENAAFSAALLKQRGIHHVLLVTSALHMPRALKLFVEQGLDVEPAPTDYESDQLSPGLLGWLPDTGALDGSGRAIKELVGLWVRR